jgi:hypothetical protein
VNLRVYTNNKLWDRYKFNRDWHDGDKRLGNKMGVIIWS